MKDSNEGYRWHTILEKFFGAVAKGTIAVLCIAVVILTVMSGDVGGFTDLPTTRKEWLFFLVVVLTVVILSVGFAFVHGRTPD